MRNQDNGHWLPGDILSEDESDWHDPDDADNFDELEAYWLDMPEEEGVDIFHERYGDPTGKED